MAGASVTGTCTDNAGNTSSAATSPSFDYDATAPTGVAGTLDRSADHGTWYNHAVGITFVGTDATSGIASCSHPSYSGPDMAGASVTGTCTDNAGNTSSAATSPSFDYDATAPAVTVTPDRTPDSNGWYNHAVVYDTAGTDATSGVSDADCTANQTYNGPDGTALTLAGSCTDAAGNVGNGTSLAFQYDATAPGAMWTGGPIDGGSYYFGFLPATPTCTATDVLSGPNDCTVTGYDTAVGLHTMTATAHDVAGNTGSYHRSYTVVAWTLFGFYQPVDMPNPGIVYNTIKGGSTVPLKFEVFAGPTELTDTSYVHQPLLSQQVACTGTSYDAVEITATGGTSLRYDTAGSQFIYNWQTPKTAGKCYRVTVGTADGSSLVAYFMTK
jgi:hypothetical protein